MRRRLKTLVDRRDAMIVPGAANALSARIIEDLGFEAIYVTGAGLSNTNLGLPDMGLLTVTELVDTTSRIADVTSLPLVVDMDTGFGNALNVYRTVRTLERAGAAALQIEDQVFPKRCGHFSGKEVIPLDEMLNKLKAALDARQDSNLQIIARTDSRAGAGIEHALERANAFMDVGADIVFVEAPVNRDEIARIAAMKAPQVINIVIGGNTPMLSLSELKTLGVSMVLYANAGLQASVLAMQEVLGHLLAKGSLTDIGDRLASFSERQRLVGKNFFDELEKRYVDKSDR